MKFLALVGGGVLLFAILLSGQASAQIARAELYNAQGEKVGIATLMERSDGVAITLQVFKLPPGTHGFHIHAVGKCEPPGFTSAGGHFNPHGKKHGLKSPDGAHGGDLRNLEVRPDGTATTIRLASLVTLVPGMKSLFHPDGTALVIHADPDDYMTDPTGNAGARIACGFITR
ncbi:MAG: superoxide dismutase family protein [Candidatus Methylomirabilis sp.]